MRYIWFIIYSLAAFSDYEKGCTDYRTARKEISAYLKQYARVK